MTIWKKYIKNKKPPAGFLLIDVLVVMFLIIVAIKIINAFTIENIKRNQLYKNYIIAENLLNEEIEVAKNLPDSNALLQPTKKECWLALNESCSGKAKMAKTGSTPHYVISMANGLWTWQEKSQPFYDQKDLDGDGSYFSKVYRLYLKTDGDATNYVIYDGKNFGRKATKFYSSINFSQIDTITHKSAIAEVMVAWQNGQQIYYVKKTVGLFNKLK